MDRLWLLMALCLGQMLFAAHGNELCERHLDPYILGALLDIGMRSERAAAVGQAE